MEKFMMEQTQITPKTETLETELTSRIQVENLVVNPRTKREIAIGDADSFLRVTKDTRGISAILWNEEGITLMTKDYSTIITFRPELNQSVTMFFMREHKRENVSFFGEQTGMRVWEGDFEPIKFSKGNLVKFLKKYTLKENTELMNAIKEMKITERKSRTETMIDLNEEDNFQAVEEQVKSTNIPANFTLEVPLIENPLEQAYVSLEFEAKVVENEDRYSDRDKGKKYIQLRCINARQVLKQMMQDYVNRLPKGIPRYYGRLNLESVEGRSNHY
jgi:hypothetical protein